MARDTKTVCIDMDQILRLTSEDDIELTNDWEYPLAFERDTAIFMRVFGNI